MKITAIQKRTRLCMVDGEICAFHRFIDNDEVLVEFNSMIRTEDALAVMGLFHREKIVPCNAHTKILRKTYALVERPDGTLIKVDPEKVRFKTKRRADE